MSRRGCTRLVLGIAMRRLRLQRDRLLGHAAMDLQYHRIAYLQRRYLAIEIRHAHLVEGFGIANQRLRWRGMCRATSTSRSSP